MPKMGFAQVGAGLFGQRHAQAYSRHPSVDYVAVCDLNEERARKTAEQYGARLWYTSLDEMLKNPDIAAVSIATPDNAHRAVAIAAAKAGKHILVEKPLATTVAEAQAIADAAREAGVKLMVDFHNRVNPPIAAAKEAIQRGDLGTPSYVYARLSNTTMIPLEMLAWAGQSSALWFLASHTFDLVRWLLDDEPRKIYAVQREGVLHRLGVQAPDFHLATVEFRRGAVAVFENAWILPRTHPTVKDMKVEILGSEGAIYIDTSHNRTMETYSAEKAIYPDLMAPPTGPHLTGFVLDSIARFIDAVTLDTPVLATGEDGVATTRALVAMMESAAKGEPVYLE